MGEGVARSLATRGTADVCVANRTAARGKEIAKRIGARWITLDRLEAELLDADLLVTSTASQQVLVERSAVEAVMEQREHRPLLVVDVALPRDVDPGVRDVDGVTLLDLDDLKDYAQRSAELRRREIGRVREILASELERYRADGAAREVAPLVTALRAFGEDVREGELERYESKLAGLTDAQRKSVEALTRGIVNKLLHEPTTRVKDAAGSGRGEYLSDALAALYDLPETPED
jgi:glutamyl-tRNA reductase